MAENSQEKQELEQIGRIGKEEWQTWDYSKGEFGINDDEKANIDAHELVIDYIQKKARKSTPAGLPPFLGHVFYVAPLNTDIVLDFTTMSFRILLSAWPRWM